VYIVLLLVVLSVIMDTVLTDSTSKRKKRESLIDSFQRACKNTKKSGYIPEANKTQHRKIVLKQREDSIRECPTSPGHLRIRLVLRSRSQSAVEEQIGASVVALLSAKHIIRTDVRYELVVDADPRVPWPVVQITVRMQDVQCVVAARGRLAVVV
jgi:hypothetical protein